jgi:hypothetical protein
MKDMTCLNIPCESEERLLYTLVDFGARLHEPNTKLVRECSALLGRDLALVLPVRLVPNENLVYTVGRVLFNIRMPRSNIYSPTPD